MDATIADKVRSRLQVRMDLPTPERRRELRQAAGFTQQELAEIIGVTRGSISNWETGCRTTPRGILLDRYVAALRTLQDCM